MLGTRILVAYDGAELSVKALDIALQQLRENPQISVDVVFVEEVAPLRTGVEVVDEDIQCQRDAIFNQLRDKVATVEMVKLHRLRGQNVSYVLLRFAEEHNCNLIVLGSRGLTGIREFLGSVSHAVVQHSLVPVLIIK